MVPRLRPRDGPGHQHPRAEHEPGLQEVQGESLRARHERHTLPLTDLQRSLGEEQGLALPSLRGQTVPLNGSPVMSSAQRVLLTGATGFVGSALSHALHQRGHVITALCRRPERAMSELPLERAWPWSAGEPLPEEALESAEVVIASDPP